MQIAVVVPSLTRSATITVALNIAAGLIAAGRGVDVFYFDDNVEQTVPVGCQAFRIGFFQKIDFRKYDVIHSHNLRPDLYVAINRSHIRGVCISTIHNYVREELENYHGKFASLVFTQVWKAAWNRFDRLVCLTKSGAEYYRDLLPAMEVSYVYNGVSIIEESTIQADVEVVAAANYLKNKGLFVLGTYCNQIKRKGLDQIIRLLYETPHVAAIIIGDGPENQFLRSLAKELDVEDRCLFFPYLPRAYIYNKFFGAYIIPSRSEGFGIALVEAALCNVNIMCSDITAFREMFDESEVSFFKLDDTEGMLDIVDRIGAGLDKRSLAMQKARNLYSIDAMTASYVGQYNKTLGRS